MTLALFAGRALSFLLVASSCEAKALSDRRRLVLDACVVMVGGGGETEDDDEEEDD